MKSCFFILLITIILSFSVSGAEHEKSQSLKIREETWRIRKYLREQKNNAPDIKRVLDNIVLHCDAVDALQYSNGPEEKSQDHLKRAAALLDHIKEFTETKSKL